MFRKAPTRWLQYRRVSGSLREKAGRECFHLTPLFFFTSYIGMECGFSHSKEKGKKLALALWGLTNIVITHRYVYLVFLKNVLNVLSSFHIFFLLLPGDLSSGSHTSCSRKALSSLLWKPRWVPVVSDNIGKFWMRYFSDHIFEIKMSFHVEFSFSIDFWTDNSFLRRFWWWHSWDLIMVLKGSSPWVALPTLIRRRVITEDILYSLQTNLNHNNNFISSCPWHQIKDNSSSQ